MAKKFFGTDGIRGTANKLPMTADIALKLGMAAGTYFLNGSHRHKVVIGKDTRLSGYMVEPALTSGLVSVGMDVFLLGPIPTPAVAMLTRSLRADLGVMISASHNLYKDNGIKLFDRFGLKLSDQAELEIESIMSNIGKTSLANPDKLGRATRIDDSTGRYIEYLKNSFPKRSNLSGIKIVLDCANGAAYKIAPTVLWELEADLITIGNEPNGFNINQNCGSTATEKMRASVIENKADIGIALDGDADRLIVCDELGNIIDGDQLMAAIAKYQKELGNVKGGGIVTTSMSNMALEGYLSSIDLVMKRTDVGDRHVSKYMRENGYNIGGEQSGHLIMRDYSTTGDGMIAALQLLAIMAKEQKPASKLFKLFTPFPQKLKNFRFENKNPLENKKTQDKINKISKKIEGQGRVLIRKSGTEPLIRVMAEGKDEEMVENIVDEIIANLCPG